jgi:hypothetical protein
MQSSGRCVVPAENRNMKILFAEMPQSEDYGPAPGNVPFAFTLSHKPVVDTVIVKANGVALPSFSFDIDYDTACIRVVEEACAVSANITTEYRYHIGEKVVYTEESCGKAPGEDKIFNFTFNPAVPGSVKMFADGKPIGAFQEIPGEWQIDNGNIKVKCAEKVKFFVGGAPTGAILTVTYKQYHVEDDETMQRRAAKGEWELVWLEFTRPIRGIKWPLITKKQKKYLEWRSVEKARDKNFDVCPMNTEDDEDNMELNWLLDLSPQMENTETLDLDPLDGPNLENIEQFGFSLPDNEEMASSD